MAQAVTPAPDGGYANGSTAEESDALFSLTSGVWNTALGYKSLYHLTTGRQNTATGASALQSNSTGAANTANGLGALFNNTCGSYNIAMGNFAGRNLITGSYNIDIGNEGVAGEAHTIRVGTQGTQTKTFIAGIYGSNEGGTISPLYINNNGQLGTQPPASAQRFKKQIKRMDRASEGILALKPVTFQYESDASGTPQFGLIAEEVAEINPDLVVRDEKGEIYTVRYEAVNAMLLDEFIKEHREVEELKAAVTQLMSRLKEQDSKIQTMSDQRDMSKTDSRVVANRQ